MTTLGYALLGLLARRSMTGYGLARSMTEPIGFFWTAKHSQIYPELARLTGAGLARYEVIDGPGPRDTKRYEITPEGYSCLREWLAEPMQLEQPRDRFMLKVWSLWAIDREAATALIAGQRDVHTRQLAVYEDAETKQRASFGARLDDPADEAFASHAVLRRGIVYERMALDWCDWLLHRLRTS
ncbi:MAG: PadR family transcriptional regulator [Streptosporangiales bacterium]